MSRDSATLTVRVLPRASRQGVVGMHGEALRVAVNAPPERGKANDALRALLAKKLGVPKSAVTIVAGAASRRKTIRVEGITPQELRTRLLREATDGT